MSRRTLIYVLVYTLCLSSIGYMFMKPTPWWRARKKVFAAALDSPLLPGKLQLKVVFLGLPALLLALFALVAVQPKITAATKPPRRSYCTANVLAVCLWAALQLGWQVTYLVRNGSTIDWKWLKKFAESFGLSATINVQLILVPVSRSSPVLRLLGVPSEGLVYVHRFLGIGTALLLATHGALYLIAWTHDRELVKKLLEWPTKGVANLPGELGFLASVALYIFSRPSVRRRSFELFAYTHRTAAAAFFACAALHWSGFLWFTLPGTLLYLADYATHARADKARVEHVRLNSGVLSLTLSCPPLVRGGRPLQWIMLKAPSVSCDWHPFSLTGSPHGSSGTVSLSIGVIDGGWTQALSERLSSADGVASTKILLSGCYGLGFDLGVYDAGSPLLLICGGSGGTPFSALLGAIAQRPAIARPPPVTLVWICRSRSELDEYVRAGDLMRVCRACDAISLVLYVSQPAAAPRALGRALTLALSPEAGEGQTANLASPSAASGRDGARFDPHTQLALLCHVCMSAATIGGMAVGNAFYPKEGAALAQLVGFLLGAGAGALVAHAGFACLSIDLRRCRSRLRSASLAALRHAKIGGARTLPVHSAHAAMRRADELPAASYAWVMEADEADADTKPADADVREGRPDIEEIMKAFEARVEMKSLCHTLVSGPPGLVRDVSKAARSRRHVVHAVSFAV